jgi:SAM-dependent methyltransferase
MKRRPNKVVPLQDVADMNMQSGLSLNSDADNYLNWISDLCAPFLGENILEIGAGHGDFTERFSKVGSVVATEVSEGSLEYLRNRFENNRKVQIRKFEIHSTPTQLFDSIVLINVLEHIENDVDALCALSRHLKPNGHLVVYVPAFWLLYSRFDNSIGHYRRYTRRELVDVASRASFHNLNSHYVNSVGAIGWLLICRILRRSASDGASVGVMNRWIIPVVRKFETKISPPFGISVFYAGRYTP